jgi:hypothetical protein
VFQSFPFYSHVRSAGSRKKYIFDFTAGRFLIIGSTLPLAENSTAGLLVAPAPLAE